MKSLKYYDILEYPVITEKSVNLISENNAITFIVSRSATKEEIKKAIEKMYKVKVKKINTLLDSKNRKKAIIKLKKESNAQDLANKLGIL
jgi:large subunit ribosomal protein L23